MEARLFCVVRAAEPILGSSAQDNAFSVEWWGPTEPGASFAEQGAPRLSGLALYVLIEHQYSSKIWKTVLCFDIKITVDIF